jgi:hypothetical protein
MVRITVEIDLPNVTARDLLDRDYFYGDKIIIDETYLERFPEDDNFYLFKFVKAEEGPLSPPEEATAGLVSFAILEDILEEE